MDMYSYATQKEKEEIEILEKIKEDILQIYKKHHQTILQLEKGLWNTIKEVLPEEYERFRRARMSIDNESQKRMVQIIIQLTCDVSPIDDISLIGILQNEANKISFKRMQPPEI